MDKRDVRLDFIRLISITLVITIHVCNYYNRFLDDCSSSSFVFATLYNSLARTCVPLFFMISGVLALNKPVDRSRQISKIVKFVKILVLWTLVYLAFDVLFMEYTFSAKEIADLIFEPLKPHLWFMYAIICLYITIPFAKILFDYMQRYEENLFIGLWIVFTGAVQLIKQGAGIFGGDPEITYSVPLVQGTYYFGYFMIGAILYKRILSKEKFSRKPWFIVYIICTVIIFAGTYSVSAVIDKYYDEFFTYRNIFIISASISLFVLIMKTYKGKYEKLNQLFMKMSPNLFGVYLIHIIFFDLLVRTVNIRLIHASVGVPLYVLSIFAVSYAATVLIKKIPVLGKYM